MTSDRDGNRSNPYQPNPEMCCEACTFGSGEHAPWCEVDRGVPGDPPLKAAMRWTLRQMLANA